jgi:hypothetical protein
MEFDIEMSKHHKTIRSGKSRGKSAGKSRISPVSFIVFAVLVVIGLCAWWWWMLGRIDSVPATAPTAAPTADARAKPDFQKLKGKWVRPDGGYVIEIKSVANNGKMEAAYYNPAPIYVSRAVALLDGAMIKVFMELRAENYPGSTYTLMYDPKSDQLSGIYYQALQQQSYEVFFVRME